MIHSLRYSYLAIRLGLAAVFLWFGISKFFDALYWLNAWVPSWAVSIVGRAGLSGEDFIYLIGVFEVLIGVSLLTGVFIRSFSVLGIIFLLFILASRGINELTVRDLGILGGFMSIILWPPRSSIY